jgi:hypothetical protein
MRSEAPAFRIASRRPSSVLKALREAGGFERVRLVFPRRFAAEARRRENFCGIRELQWVERAANALHGNQVGFSEHLGHHFLFVLADTMFSGDGTARLDT